MRFADNLRHARLEAEMSQHSLAEKAGLSYAYVSMLERGLRQPGVAAAMALARVLRKPLHSLLEES